MTPTVDTLKTSDLAEMAAPYNPRTISKHDLEALVYSMKSFGTVEPIVVNRRTKRIVGGHQRVKAAQKLGLDKLPAVWVDLDETQEKQLNLALNRITGEWNETMLAELLGSLAPDKRALTGFTSDEIDRLLDTFQVEKVEENDVTRLDQRDPVICPECGHEFTP